MAPGSVVDWWFNTAKLGSPRVRLPRNTVDKEPTMKYVESSWEDLGRKSLVQKDRGKRQVSGVLAGERTDLSLYSANPSGHITRAQWPSGSPSNPPHVPLQPLQRLCEQGRVGERRVTGAEWKTTDGVAKLLGHPPRGRAVLQRTRIPPRLSTTETVLSWRKIGSSPSPTERGRCYRSALFNSCIVIPTDCVRRGFTCRTAGRPNVALKHTTLSDGLAKGCWALKWVKPFIYYIN